MKVIPGIDVNPIPPIRIDNGELIPEVEVVVEGALLESFSADIYWATGLPVFDYIAYIDLLYRAIVPKCYQGFL